MPLLRDRINFSVELSHANGLRVKDSFFNRLKSIVFGALLVQSSHGVLKNIIASSLSTACRSHKHDSESHIEGLKQLNGLQKKHRVLLKAKVCNGVLNLGL